VREGCARSQGKSADRMSAFLGADRMSAFPGADRMSAFPGADRMSAVQITSFVSAHAGHTSANLGIRPGEGVKSPRKCGRWREIKRSRSPEGLPCGGVGGGVLGARSLSAYNALVFLDFHGGSVILGV